MNPFRILWTSAANVYDNLFPMVGMNVIWFILTVPLVFFILGLARLLGIILDQAFTIFPVLAIAILMPSPASIGIHNYASQQVKDERVEFALFWSGLKALWWRASVLFLIGVVADILLFVNMRFYFEAGGVLRYVAILWFYAFLLWSMMLLYMNPLLVEQSDKSFRLLIRNAFLLCLDNLVPSLIILIILFLVSVLSAGIGLLLVLVAGCYIAFAETQAVSAYLEKIRSRTAKSSK